MDNPEQGSYPYNDSSLTPTDAEHLYYSYWREVMKQRPLTDADVQEIVTAAQRPGWLPPASALLHDMAEQDVLRPEFLPILQDRFPSDMHGSQQVEMWWILHDPEADWEQQIQAAIRYRSWWALKLLLNTLTADQKTRLVEAVAGVKATRPLPKWVRALVQERAAIG